MLYPIFVFIFSLANAQNQDTDYSLQSRYKQESIVNKLDYAISPYKPFYILPLAYNFNPDSQNISGLKKTDSLEVKFQFSFKFNIIDSFLNDKFQLTFGYTNLSFWQLYNDSQSSPFRETNHEPELFFTYKPSGFSDMTVDQFYVLGFSHQSNGQGIPASRSWNRLYLQGVYNFKELLASIKIWHRLPYKNKAYPTDPDGDDNPDILNYMGHFELMLVKKIDDHTLTAIWRNNLKDQNNKGAIELSWSFPMSGRFKGYVQYFNGYGESMIDYNHTVQRASIGLITGDWL